MNERRKYNSNMKSLYQFILPTGIRGLVHMMEHGEVTPLEGVEVLSQFGE